VGNDRKMNLAHTLVVHVLSFLRDWDWVKGLVVNPGCLD